MIFRVLGYWDIGHIALDWSTSKEIGITCHYNYFPFPSAHLILPTMIWNKCAALWLRLNTWLFRNPGRVLAIDLSTHVILEFVEPRLVRFTRLIRGGRAYIEKV